MFHVTWKLQDSKLVKKLPLKQWFSHLIRDSKPHKLFYFAPTHQLGCFFSLVGMNSIFLDGIRNHLQRIETTKIKKNLICTSPWDFIEPDTLDRQPKKFNSLQSKLAIKATQTLFFVGCTPSLSLIKKLFFFPLETSPTSCSVLSL